jgi:protein-S-isoprenylcysteine O-methyltransferase Ste14
MVLPVPWVFVLSYLVGVALEHLLPLRIVAKAPPHIGLIGAVLFGIGALVAGWAWFLFHKADTTRIPGQRSTTLVTWGPYTGTRNPMYVGMTLAYLGEAAILRQLWPVLILPLTLSYLNWTVVPVEETRLREAFGAAYDDYRAKVRRWI